MHIVCSAVAHAHAKKTPVAYRIYYENNIDLRHQYGISVAESQSSSSRNVPSGEERGETAVFPGYGYLKNKNLNSNDVFTFYEQELAQLISTRSSNSRFDFSPFSVALGRFKKCP